MKTALECFLKRAIYLRGDFPSFLLFDFLDVELLEDRELRSLFELELFDNDDDDNEDDFDFELPLLPLDLPRGFDDLFGNREFLCL